MAVFDEAFFEAHAQALNTNFAPTAEEKRQLAAYILSITEEDTPLAIPPVGANGGDFCSLVAP